MSKKKSNQTQLILDSQDPRQFCLKMIQTFPLEIDPLFIADSNLELTRHHFFVNRGWRLTTAGFRLLSKHYEHWACDNPANLTMTGRILLNMDHAVGGPWYLGGQKLYVFDPSIHFEMELVGGDAKTFVEFKGAR